MLKTTRVRTSHTIIGPIVMLSSILLTACLIVSFANPWQQGPKEMQQAYRLCFQSSTIVSFFGGLYMFMSAKDRRWLWSLAPFVPIVLAYVLLGGVGYTVH